MFITLPFLPFEESTESRCCYTFQRFYKLNKHKSDQGRVLESIGMAAEEMGLSPVYVSKVLVEYGMRAPKESFPPGFVDFVESKSKLDPWAAGAMTYAQNKLAKIWQITPRIEMMQNAGSFVPLH